MARPLRLQFPGAVYHVMACGNHAQPIFRGDQDRRRWLKTLGEACVKTGWQVHAFGLMGDHYHLQLQTPEANLVAGMKWLQGTFTQRYHGRHRCFGTCSKAAIRRSWWMAARPKITSRWSALPFT